MSEYEIGEAVLLLATSNPTDAAQALKLMSFEQMMEKEVIILTDEQDMHWYKIPENANRWYVSADRKPGSFIYRTVKVQDKYGNIKYAKVVTLFPLPHNKALGNWEEIRHIWTPEDMIGY